MFIKEWWEGMSAVQHLFMFAAIPATLILAIQTLMLLFGLGDGGGDADFDADAADVQDGGFDAHEDFSNCDSAHDLDGDLRVFTVRGFVAFFAVFGWTGSAMLSGSMPVWFAAIAAFFAGAAAMVVIALIMKSMLKLQQSGNINNRNAVGKSGVVYITVPPQRSGSGKINLVVQERYSEMEAVTDSREPIVTGREVTVVGVTTLGTLIVKEK